MRRPGIWLAALGLVVCSAAGARAAGDESFLDAAKRGDRDALRTALARRVDVNAPEADGTTALHWAVRADDAESVAMLLGAGANANAANRYGITPLWLASTNGNAAVIESLIKAGAAVDTALPSGETALLVATRSGSPAAVRTLLARGANANVKESAYGQTPLMLAAAENHPEVCRLLIQSGARLNEASTVVEPQKLFLSQSYRGGFTPLHYAARQGAIETGRVLLEARADLNAREPDGISPLVLALFNGHYAYPLGVRKPKRSNHNLRGSIEAAGENVLMMDGHVEWQPFIKNKTTMVISAIATTTITPTVAPEMPPRSGLR